MTVLFLGQRRRVFSRRSICSLERPSHSTFAASPNFLFSSGYRRKFRQRDRRHSLLTREGVGAEPASPASVLPSHIVTPMACSQCSSGSITADVTWKSRPCAAFVSGRVPSATVYGGLSLSLRHVMRQASVVE